ncbi:MAG: LysR family transcriptional regulator, partial [Xanthomonadaceae bacterium]|nr:LysR family transcriptional regulator [Xanthomonadaceae bacterium]
MTQLSGTLQDLNDLYFFAAVVEHGGFSAAGRALGMPKSRLSKRVAQLEDRLGVRLLQRTTRRFVVTEIGERFYAHCRAVLEEARAAQDAVDELRAEPRGVVRLSCPVSLTQTVLA